MTKIINELEHYQTIPTALIEDTTLTPEARLLYCLMAVKPKDWVFYQQPLMQSACIRDKRTFFKHMQQLINRGWIACEGQTRNDDGTFNANIYIIKATAAEVQKMTEVQNLPYRKICRTAKNAPHTNINTNIPKIHFDNDSACDVRACEEDYHREMLANESAIEALCMRHHTDKENLQKKAEEFRLHCIAGAVTHESEQDYQKHFRDWLNINLQSNETTANNISRDEQRRQESQARKQNAAARIIQRLRGNNT